MIQVNNLTKRLGGREVVSGVSFSVARGEVLGFLGPNGAGKTTTLRMLTTYLTPTSGSASLAGHDLLSQATKVRSLIGYMPERPPLYGDLSVEEYLRFVASIRGIPAAHLSESLTWIMESFTLGEVRKQLCKFLSRGYRQRVGLAQALIHKPEILILDEPTSGLDPQQVVELRKLIADLAKQRTVLLSTHMLSEVHSLCSKVVIINSGVVVLEKALADLPRDSSLEEVFLLAIGGGA